MWVESLHVYPLKSAAAWSPARVRVWGTGLEQDRRFVLVDAAGHFVTQRTLPLLAHLHVELGTGVTLRYQGREVFRAGPEGGPTLVEVWGDRVEALDWGPAFSSFFSRVLGQPLRLCEALPEQTRWVKERYTAGTRVPYFFADGFPILVISQESLDLLNQKLQEQGLPSVGMDRFRGNVIVKGWSPHGEDQAKRIRIGENVELALAKPCSRCSVITVDPATAVAGSEPLQTLASYRKGPEGGKIFFGQNAYVLQGAGSEIAVGDPVRILE